MKRVFYPVQTTLKDRFCSNVDIISLNNPLSPCEELKNFIISEEEVSFNDWKKYRESVVKYEKGVSEKDKPQLIITLARQLVAVLKSDLRIFKNMKNRPECVDPTYYKDIDASIDFTKNTIDFYENGKVLQDTIFNPFKEPEFNEYPQTSGTFWDTEFYKDYESVAKYVIGYPSDKEVIYELPKNQLADWQTNPPPYPFKIIDDNTGFWRNVTEQGIEDYAFGTTIFVTPSSPTYEYYSKWRLCREGECV